MDPMEPFLTHLDELWKLALSKTGNPADADDLTQETYLAALTAIRRGKEIRYPRTWLAGTMMHLWSSRLRQKYREQTVCWNELTPAPYETPVEEASGILTEEEQTAENLLQRRVASLTRLYRDVITLHYIGGKSVAEIARWLNVPEGTVKRRLHDGREKMKKESAKMETKELKNCTPMQVGISWTGTYPGDAVISLAHTHLMGQILATAYDKPLSVEEIAEKIGVPVYYFEDALEKAVKVELMCRTAGDKYYANAYLRDLDHIPAQWQATKGYVTENSTAFADSMNRIERAVAELDAVEGMNPRQVRKLQRFAFIEMLQAYLVHPFTDVDIELPVHASGREWLLIGHRIPLGMEKPKDVDILAGHRTSGGGDQDGDSYTLHEFDTTLWDHPSRYLDHSWLFLMADLIYAIHRGKDPLSLEIPAEMVEKLPAFTENGIFAQTDEGLVVDLPILNGKEYSALQELCQREADTLRDEIADSLVRFRDSHQPHIPAHLGETAAYWKYPEALTHLIPAVYRVLYDRGLYLQDVDYCCPPVVFVLN